MVDSMSETEVTAEKQRPAHLFKAGVSGNPNGRPKGARSRLNTAFITDVHIIWEESGIEALRACAAKTPNEFCRIVALLMPRDVNLAIGIDPTAFADKLAQAAALLDVELDPPRRLRKALPGMPRTIEHDDVGRL